MEGVVEECDNNSMKIVSLYDVGFGVLRWYKSRGRTDDFRDGHFEIGNLQFARELLGPHGIMNGRTLNSMIRMKND